MLKSTAFFLLLIIPPCHAMQMAAQQADQNTQTLDEAAAAELIQKLLEKKYSDMTSEVSKLSDEQNTFIKSILNKRDSCLTDRVRLQQVLAGHHLWIESVAFSPDGKFALTGSSDHTARLWNLVKSPITSQELIGHTDRIRSVACSPNGHFALTGSEDKTARLWDLTKFPITCLVLTGHTHWVTRVAFSPDNRFALTGSSDNKGRLWDLTQSPIASKELIGHTDPITSVAFSPDSRFALTGSCDNSARLWDLTKSPITSQELTGHTNTIMAVAFSPDGRSALTGSYDKTARLWDLTKSPIASQKLTGHTFQILSVAFSPNGRFCLTGSDDRTARLWDLTKSPIISQELRGHTAIISVAFSPNSCFALTGSWDNSAHLWDLRRSPVTSQELTGHKSGVLSVAFSPDGHYFLTGSRDATTRYWKIEPFDGTALALEDLLLIIKLIENEDSLKDDTQALDRLQLIMKTEQHKPVITKLIADYLYRSKLPEKVCWICSEMYDTETHICMQLECCPKTICKFCLDRLGGMSYSFEYAGYQFEHSVKNKCPFCNKPANQMGTIKRFNTDPNNHHCSTCDKEKCTLKCGACKTNYYCSKECQAKDWPAHKATCKKK